MDYKICVPEGADYVLVQVFSPMTLRLAERIAPEAEKVGMAAKTKNLFFDLRQTHNIENIHDLIKLAKEGSLPDSTDAYFNRISVLVKPGDTSNSLIIVALANNGFNICQFENEQEALDWFSK